jgi:hypothetical protein
MLLPGVAGDGNGAPLGIVQQLAQRMKVNKIMYAPCDL